jgi:hypothetical protein
VNIRYWIGSPDGKEFVGHVNQHIAAKSESLQTLNPLTHAAEILKLQGEIGILKMLAEPKSLEEFVDVFAPVSVSPQ